MNMSVLNFPVPPAMIAIYADLPSMTPFLGAWPSSWGASKQKPYGSLRSGLRMVVP
jgi:hypothetical protein